MLQELSQWRQQKLQESLRNSVLDEEAAAKFSTAAALAAKEKRKEMAKANYDKGLLAAVDDDKFREVGHLTFDDKMAFAACSFCLHAINLQLAVSVCMQPIIWFGPCTTRKEETCRLAGQRSANFHELCEQCHWSSK